MDDLEMAKQAEEELPADRRAEELKLYHAYAKNPVASTFQPLYRSFKPFLYKAAKINMVRSPIPQSAHVMLAAQSFHDALRTFKPGMRSLHSHVFDTVREKGKRLNYKYQNIGYIPEARNTKYQMFQNTIHRLKEELGREPSTMELADDLHWSPKMVETLIKETRKDLILDEMLAETHRANNSNAATQLFQDLQYGLIPPHQLVLEHAVGLNGKMPLIKPSGGPDIGGIAKATGLKVPQIRSALKTITRKVKEYRGQQIITTSLGEEEDYADV